MVVIWDLNCSYRFLGGESKKNRFTPRKIQSSYPPTKHARVHGCQRASLTVKRKGAEVNLFFLESLLNFLSMVLWVQTATSQPTHRFWAWGRALAPLGGRRRGADKVLMHFHFISFHTAVKTTPRPTLYVVWLCIANLLRNEVFVKYSNETDNPLHDYNE